MNAVYLYALDLNSDRDGENTNRTCRAKHCSRCRRTVALRSDCASFLRCPLRMCAPGARVYYANGAGWTVFQAHGRSFTQMAHPAFSLIRASGVGGILNRSSSSNDQLFTTSCLWGW